MLLRAACTHCLRKLPAHTACASYLHTMDLACPRPCNAIALHFMEVALHGWGQVGFRQEKLGRRLFELHIIAPAFWHFCSCAEGGRCRLQVSAGENHTLCISDSGEVFGFGWNFSSARRLTIPARGHGDSSVSARSAAPSLMAACSSVADFEEVKPTASLVAVRVATCSRLSAFLAADGRVYFFIHSNLGERWLARPVPNVAGRVFGFGDVVALAVSPSELLVSKSQGELLRIGFGSNELEPFVGATVATIPSIRHGGSMAVGSSHSCVISIFGRSHVNIHVNTNGNTHVNTHVISNFAEQRLRTTPYVSTKHRSQQRVQAVQRLPQSMCCQHSRSGGPFPVLDWLHYRWSGSGLAAGPQGPNHPDRCLD